MNTSHQSRPRSNPGPALSVGEFVVCSRSFRILHAKGCHGLDYITVISRIHLHNCHIMCQTLRMISQNAILRIRIRIYVLLNSNSEINTMKKNKTNQICSVTKMKLLSHFNWAEIKENFHLHQLSGKNTRQPLMRIK